MSRNPIPIYICLILALCLLTGNTVSSNGNNNKGVNSADTVAKQALQEGPLHGIDVRIVWQGNEDFKKVALTFDDGPSEKHTPEILDILKKYKVRATFFLLGKNAEQNPQIIKRIHQEGHLIGMHTYSHKELTKTPTKRIKNEILDFKQYIFKQTGTVPRLIRPPWGVYDNRTMAEMAVRNLDVILWSIDSRDWSEPGSKIVEDNILRSVRNGSIILCHDTHSDTVLALPKVIEKIKAQGYEFVTINDILKDLK